MSKQRLLFITTGGTIASVRTAQGLKPVLSSEELLAHLPELQELCCPETLALCSIDSTDLGPGAPALPPRWARQSRSNSG